MSLRKQPRRLGVITAAVVLLSIFLGALANGCGGDSPDTSVSTSAAPTSMSVTNPTTSAATPTSVDNLEAELNGAGATFPQPLYVEWIGFFQEIYPKVKINYQGVGSGAGIEQFTAQTVDFGASDAYMKPDELSAAEAARPGAKVLHIPTVFGAVTLAYNLPGVEELKLDAAAVADIFLGKITQWDDPALKALNPDVTLPSLVIHTVHRSDSSGTTNAFTSYLAAVNQEWQTGPGAGKEVQWNGGVGGKGNDGVAAVVKQTEGAIGYVELAYAVQNDMKMAQIKNRSGRFVAPSIESTSAAAAGIEVPADMNLKVSDSPNPEAYPIVTATYILAYDKMPDSNKAEALKAFLTWALSDDGTAVATELGYAPLPSDLKNAVLEIIASIGF